MVRMLVVGNVSEGTLESYYYYYLQKRNDVVCEVSSIHADFYKYYNRRIWNKLIYKTGASNIYKKLNKAFLKKVNEFKPDVVLVFKGMEIFPSTLQTLRADTSLKLINYNPDHPYSFFGKGTGNKNVLRGIPYYHLHISYSEIISASTSEKFGVQTATLPFGHFYHCDKLVDEDDELLRICFIGNPDKQRYNAIKKIAMNGLPIDVYGNGWQKWFKKDQLNIKCFPPVYGYEFIECAKKYRLGLNLFRPHNIDAHNMRSFELFAAGTIQLLPFTEQQAKFFLDEKEVVYYHSEDELIEKASWILNMDFEDASKIKQNALSKCAIGRYSYQHRVDNLMDLIEKLV